MIDMWLSKTSYVSKYLMSITLLIQYVWNEFPQSHYKNN